MADLVPQEAKEILSISLNRINGNKKFHCVVVFLCTDDTIIQLDIPEIEMDEFAVVNETFKEGDWYSFLPIKKSITKVVFGEGLVHPVNGITFTLEDITPYHEMTIREIEKELGYKIKIKK